MQAGNLQSTVAVALMFAWRYLFARSHGYATFINWVSFAGLALGVMILTVVVSVMNGFDREITKRILSVIPHAVVTSSQPTFDAEPLRAVAGVAQVSRFWQSEAMLLHGAGRVDFVALVALDEDGLRHTPAFGEAALVAFSTRGEGVLMGTPLAAARGLAVGDALTLVLPSPSSSGVRPRLEHFVLAGTFETGADPDTGLVVALRSAIVQRGALAAGTDGWRLHLAAPSAAPALADDIRAALSETDSVHFWMEDYGDLFRAVEIEKAMMFALLALIVAIASFNIVSGQTMLVNDKRRDVAMLTTMGAARPLLIWVFFLQGFSVAATGVACGLVCGVLVAMNAGPLGAAVGALTGANIVDGTWFSEVPSEVQPEDLGVIAALALGLSLMAVLVPAFKATAANPADALHAA